MRKQLANIYIITVFTRIRGMLLTQKDVLLKLEQLERKVIHQDGDIRMIFEYLQEFLNPVAKRPRKIGFKRKNEG